MTVPTWDEFMVPVLRELSGEETIRRRDLFDRVARSTGLSETDMAEILNSGQPRYENRIGWAISYLKKVEGIDYPKRGYYAITERGRELLDKYPAGITEKELRKFVDYPDTPSTRAALELTSEAANEHSIQQSKLDPIEQIEDGVKRLYMSIAGDLLMVTSISVVYL